MNIYNTKRNRPKSFDDRYEDKMYLKTLQSAGESSFRLLTSSLLD